MRFYCLTLGTLCVWRITHLLKAEDGPWDMFVHLRRLAGEGFWGQLLDCFYCLSLWIAAPLAWSLGQGWKERLLLWPSLSAGAALLEKLTSRQEHDRVPPATYTEDSEDSDVLLREEPSSVSDRRSRSGPH
jgi:hypothetical protein